MTAVERDEMERVAKCMLGNTTASVVLAVEDSLSVAPDEWPECAG